jgi:hypothetical protein
MDLDNILNTGELEGLHLDVMFGAVPRKLIGDVSKKFNKRKTKNLFYIIFGVYLQESKQYIVFTSVFKSSKKKIDGQWFSEVMVDSAVFEDKQKVLDHLYDFMDNFEEHERIINEEIMSLGVMEATEAFQYLLVWNKGIFDYFNVYIESQNKKKSGLFNIF